MCRAGAALGVRVAALSIPAVTTAHAQSHPAEQTQAILVPAGVTLLLVTSTRASVWLTSVRAELGMRPSLLLVYVCVSGLLSCALAAHSHHRGARPWESSSQPPRPRGRQRAGAAVDANAADVDAYLAAEADAAAREDEDPRFISEAKSAGKQVPGWPDLLVVPVMQGEVEPFSALNPAPDYPAVMRPGGRTWRRALVARWTSD